MRSPGGPVPTTEGCHTSWLGGSEPDPLESFAIEKSGQGDLASAKDHQQWRIKDLRLKSSAVGSHEKVSRGHFSTLSCTGMETMS